MDLFLKRQNLLFFITQHNIISPSETRFTIKVRILTRCYSAGWLT